MNRKILGYYKLCDGKITEIDESEYEKKWDNEENSEVLYFSYFHSRLKDKDKTSPALELWYKNREEHFVLFSEELVYLLMHKFNLSERTKSELKKQLFAEVI